MTDKELIVINRMRYAMLGIPHGLHRDYACHNVYKAMRNASKSQQLLNEFINTKEK